MRLDEARTLKHELRTPVNHIIGYSALLLEAAQDAGDELLARQASEIQTIGDELNKTIERLLRLNDITLIKDAVSHLIIRMVENLEPTSTSTLNDSHMEDMRRIRSAIDRLHMILENPAFLPNEGTERAPL